MGDRRCVAALDYGGTKIVAGLFAADSTILGQRRVPVRLEPEVIVLGVGTAGEAILGPARVAFRARAYPTARETPILPAQFGALSSLRGAAYLALPGCDLERS